MNMLENLKISFRSLNVRGMRRSKTRKSMLNWIAKQGGHMGITFLQETHSVVGDEVSWSKEWSGKMFCSHGTSNSCGVMTLIGKHVEFVLQDKVIHESGRLVIIKCTIQGSDFILVNLYAPNSETEQLSFLNYTGDIIRSVESFNNMGRRL